MVFTILLLANEREHMKKKQVKSILIIGFTLIIFYWIVNNTDKCLSIVTNILHLFLPFLLGAAIAFVINVPMREIEKHLFQSKRALKYVKFRRTAAFLITLLLVLAIITLALFVIIPGVSDAVSQLLIQIPIATDNLVKFIEQAGKQYPDVVDEIVKQISNYEFDLQNILGLGVKNILSTGIAAVSSVLSGFVTTFIGIIFSIYILFDKDNLRRQFKKLIYCIFSKKWADKIKKVIILTDYTFSNFLRGQCLEAVILGSMFCIVLLILRIPYAFLIGILIAFTALIPIVGAFIGCIVGALLIAMVNPMQALIFVIVFLVLQQIEGNLIYPHVVGNSIGLPGLWVLVAVTIGGKLFGVVGMLLFIPICSVCYALLKQYISSKNKEEDKT